MLLFYVRHGDPVYEPDGLTALGEMQADAVKTRLGVYGVNKIFSSTSTRAYLTAKPTADALKLEVNQLDWCHEKYAWSYLSVMRQDGRKQWGFNYPPTREIFVSEEMRALGKQWYKHPMFEGTQFEYGIKRIQRDADAFLASLGYVHDHERNGYIAENPNEDRIALFAHEGFGLAFLSCVLDIPYPEFSTRFGIGHTGVTVIEFRNVEKFVAPSILTMSNDSHLFAERLPLNYCNRVKF